MPRYELKFEITFETDAVNSSEAKARISQDMKVHKVLDKAAGLNKLEYKRKGIVKCRRLNS